MLKKLFALDIDGTVLLYDGHTPSPGIFEVLRKLAQQHHVCFISGRSAGEMLPVLQKLNWAGTGSPKFTPKFTMKFAICCNGAVVLSPLTTGPSASGSSAYPFHREVLGSFSPGETVALVASLFPDTSFAAEQLNGRYVYTEGFPKRWINEHMTRVSLKALGRETVTRLVLFDPQVNAGRMVAALEAAYGEAVNATAGWSTWTDVMPPLVNKGTAVDWMRQQLGIPWSEVVVAGDGSNDVKMLELTHRRGGLSLAMGQAGSRVQEAATRVIGSVDEGGLTRALLEHL